MTEQPTDLKKTQWKKSGFSDADPRLDRTLPHSNEAEMAVIGCVLMAPNSMGACIERIKAGPEAFYDLRHQMIYATLAAMYDAREMIDSVTLSQRLMRQRQYDDVGGSPYLIQIQDQATSAHGISSYIEIVLEKYVLRKLIQTCTEIVARVYEHQEGLGTLMDESERDIMAIRQNNAATTFSSMKQLVPSAINQIEEFHQRQGRLMGLPTGLPDFDKITGGLRNGDMVVIAARPSIGKTSLAIQIAENVAITEKVPVGVFSLEMTKESLALRSLCSQARVSYRNVQEGFLAERDFPKLTGAAGKLSNAPIYIDDASGISIMQFRAKARRMLQSLGIKFLVLDYLQLLHATTDRGRRIENRQQEITEISGGVKALAKELNVPILVLSQLNREMERNKGRKPTLSDLRESGAIEQDADLVGLLYKVEVEEGEERDHNAVPTNLIIAKQRNGPTGEINLMFLRSYTRFESVAKVSREDCPNQPHND